ncbi:GGDEF domain-containing protein [Aquisalimonas sp.]|uniref:GGDEF domain-containing protein n=1 Tax=Aquisalimonas sp. TaxID=1872621 RepID=UPI0025C3334E|nr:GGDEF domain-containing protein [Aquisalimonas sp.]
MILDRHGALIDANQGLYDLLPSAGPGDPQLSVDNVFLNPTVEELLARADGQYDALIYTGLVTLGDIDGDSESWIGHAYCRESWILVVCERDVQQERQLRRQLLQLTEEYAEQERELARTNRELTYYANEAKRLSLTDPLTGLPNRRSFDQLMQHHAKLARRHGDSLTILLMDLDRFKAINDRHGHQHGDQVLRDVAAVLTERVRAGDVLSRWGGEEFTVLAPKTGHAEGVKLAERLRLAIEAIPHAEGHLPVTISIGVAERRNEESTEDFLARADAALYQAKDMGRNRTISAEPIE